MVYLSEYVNSRFDEDMQEVIDFVNDLNLPVSNIYRKVRENPTSCGWGSSMKELKINMHFDDNEKEINFAIKNGINAKSIGDNV